MPYKRKTYRRKRTYRRRRSYGKKRNRLSQQQKNSYTYIKRKYTRVGYFTWDVDANSTAFILSTIGADNVGDRATAGTYNFTLKSMDYGTQDQVQKDMDMYQKFKITGAAVKIMFNNSSEVERTAVSWRSTYSATLAQTARMTEPQMQGQPTFQAGACYPTRPIYRYYPTWRALKQHGVEWASCPEYTNWDNPNSPHYDG